MYILQHLKKFFILWTALVSLAVLADPPKKPNSSSVCRGKFRKLTLVSSNNTLPDLPLAYPEDTIQSFYPTDIDDDFRIIEVALAPPPPPNSSAYTSYYMKESEKFRGRYQLILKLIIQHISGGNPNLENRIWFHINAFINQTRGAEKAKVSNIQANIPLGSQLEIQFTSVLDFLIDYMKTGSLIHARNLNTADIERPYKTRIEKLRFLYKQIKNMPVY